MLSTAVGRCREARCGREIRIALEDVAEIFISVAGKVISRRTALSTSEVTRKTALMRRGEKHHAF